MKWVEGQILILLASMSEQLFLNIGWIITCHRWFETLGRFNKVCCVLPVVVWYRK